MVTPQTTSFYSILFVALLFFMSIPAKNYCAMHPSQQVTNEKNYQAVLGELFWRHHRLHVDRNSKEFQSLINDVVILIENVKNQLEDKSLLSQRKEVLLHTQKLAEKLLLNLEQELTYLKV